MINAIEFSKALLEKASLYQKINNIKNKKISVSIIGGEALNQSAIVIEANIIAYLIANGYKVDWVFCNRAIPVCEWSAINQKDLLLFKYNGVCSSCNKTFKKLRNTINITNLNIRSLNEYNKTNPSKYRFDLQEINEHTLTSAKRSLMISTLSSKDKNHNKLIKRLNESQNYYDQILSNILSNIKPDYCIFKHGIYLLHGTPNNILKKLKIPFSVYDTGYGNSSLVYGHNEKYNDYISKMSYNDFLDRGQINFDLEFVDDLIIKRRSGQIGINNNYVAKDWSNDNNPKRNLSVGVFCNVLWDANIVYEGTAYPSHQEFLVDIINNAIKYNEIDYYICPHPIEDKADFNEKETVAALFQSTFDELPDNVFILDREVSSYQVAEEVDVCFVYTSSIGLELAARGMLVYVFGGLSTYSNKGFVTDVNQKSELKDILNSLPLSETNEDRFNRIKKAKEFIYFQEKLHPIVLPNLPDNITNAHQVFSPPPESAIQDIMETNIANLFSVDLNT